MVLETEWQNTILTPIPDDIAPESVIRVLHDHSFLITLSPIVTRHTIREKFPDTGWIEYDIFEVVDLIPWGIWQHETNFTCAFKDKDDGVVSFLHAQLGVVSEANYTVRPAKEGGQACVLEEKIESSCNMLLKPVVEWNMMPVRKKLHEHVLEAARAGQMNAALSADKSRDDPTQSS